MKCHRELPEALKADTDFVVFKSTRAWLSEIYQDDK